MAYAGLTVVMTWPMVIHLASPYARFEEDFGLWLWNLWWTKKALVDLGTSPYFTSYLFHPTGTSLVLHTLSLYNGLVGIPLQLLGADVLTTYNLLYLSSFVIGGVGMYLLVWELTQNLFGAFLAGTAYAFSPFHTASYAWTNMWAVQWLPFVLLFTVRVLRAARPMEGIGLAITLALATLSDWYQPVLLLLASMVLALSVAFSRGSPNPLPTGALSSLLWSLMLAGLLVSPLAYLVLKELVAGDVLPYTPSLSVRFELLGIRPPFGDVISYGVVLGWIPVALAGYGIARGLDFWMRRFLVLLVVFFVLSLGEGLRLPGVAEPVLPLPFLLWRKIPLLGMIRGSHYFWPMVQVCAAILAGHGARRLWEDMEEWHLQDFSLPRPVSGVALLVLLLIEALQAPITPIPLRVHPVYAVIERDGIAGPILDAPIGYGYGTTKMHAGWSMYLQTFHRRPLVGGYTNFDGRKRLAFLAENPVLALFTDGWTPRADGVPHLEENLQSFLAKYQISWIILRKRMRDQVCDQPRMPGWSFQKFADLVAPAGVNGQLQAFRSWAVYCGDWDVSMVQKTDTLVRRVLGPPVWNDAELVAYRVR